MFYWTDHDPEEQFLSPQWSFSINTDMVDTLNWVKYTLKWQSMQYVSTCIKVGLKLHNFEWNCFPEGYCGYDGLNYNFFFENQQNIH